MPQWDDGTMGLYYKHISIDESPACGYLTDTPDVILQSCHTAVQYFLCEKDKAEHIYADQSSSPESFGIQLSKLSNSVPFTYVNCSSGHWTHGFLACDKRSACRQQGKLGHSRESKKRERSLTLLCQFELSALFTCRNGVEYVPYSLVCDHSQDCLDSSDEDFCVQPSCSGSQQFECDNKQVRSTSKDTLFSSEENIVVFVHESTLDQYDKCPSTLKCLIV